MRGWPPSRCSPPLTSPECSAMSHNESRSIPTDLRFPVCSTAREQHPAATPMCGHGPWLFRNHGWIVPDFAERFADVGFVVLLFDYRFLGSSQGEPRQLIDSQRQRDDLRRAVDFAGARHGIDANRIALWAHRSAEAALSILQRTIPILLRLSLMSQVSTCSGELGDDSSPSAFDRPARRSRRQRFGCWPRRCWTLRAAQSDYRRTTSPCTGRSITRSSVTLALAERFREVEENAPTWRNQVTPRFLFTAPRYRKGTIERIVVPLMVTVARDDAVVSSAFVKEKAANAPQPRDS